MNKKSTQPNTKSVPHGTKMNTIIIPELEEAARTYIIKRGWTETELNILRKYYGRVGTTHLAGYLKRTNISIQQQAARLGIRKV